MFHKLSIFSRLCFHRRSGAVSTVSQLLVSTPYTGHFLTLSLRSFTRFVTVRRKPRERDEMNEESDRYRVGLSDPMFTAASGTRFAYRYSFLVSLVSLVTLLPTLHTLGFLGRISHVVRPAKRGGVGPAVGLTLRVS